MSKTPPPGEPIRSDAPAAATPQEANPPRDPLDHDDDKRKGGIAPIPAVQHVVIIKADEKRGLSHGAVLAVSDADARALLKSDHARPATPTEVELAQPRIRPWKGA